MIAPGEWLRGQQRAMEAMLERMVLLSSHTADKAGCDAVGAVLRAEVPMACEVVTSARHGDHLLFHGPRPASDGGALLVGHLDTVFPKGTFEGYRVEGDRAHGPGVLDMKGGLVVVTFALKYLAEQGLLERIPVTFAVVSDEEIGSPESAPHLARVARGAACALVFESGRAGDKIITRRKGTGALTATATGRAAHAGNHHREGINAIWALARFIDRAQGLTDYDRGVTINVGKVHGGIGKNTVPDRAEAEIDLRFVTRNDADATIERLREIALDTGVSGASVSLTLGPSRPPLERSAESERVLRAYAACARAEGLGDAEAGLIGGGSDASTTAAAGVPSIDGLGPRGEGFHTRDEYMELSSLAPKAAALVGFLRDAPFGNFLALSTDLSYSR